MSHVTNVFIGEGVSLPDVARCLEYMIGHQLKYESGVDGAQFSSAFMGITLALFDNHGAEDDQGIEYSKYPLELDFSRYAGVPEVEHLTELCRLLGRIAASIISRELGCECIVVDNMQHLILEIPER